MYFKDAAINSSQLKKEFISVLELKEEIRNYQQFYSNYQNIEGLLLAIDSEIEKFLKLEILNK
ncbi:MAG: hypothetical protein Q8K92_06655 [Leadbetterella sp.]|nr:hypothetical protein [Leadbetterella sp.]